MSRYTYIITDGRQAAMTEDSILAKEACYYVY